MIGSGSQKLIDYRSLDVGGIQDNINPPCSPISQQDSGLGFCPEHPKNPFPFDDIHPPSFFSGREGFTGGFNYGS